MPAVVRDAKIYHDQVKKIVIGYELKGTKMTFGVQPHQNGDLVFTLATDSWYTDDPRSPDALRKRRLDIYMGITEGKKLLADLNAITVSHSEITRKDCAGLSAGFFPDGMESGPKKLPDGVNCFAAPCISVVLKIKDLRLELKNASKAMLYIDFERNHESHLLTFSEPALHFAVRAQDWTAVQNSSLTDNICEIRIAGRCMKAIEECVDVIVNQAS